MKQNPKLTLLRTIAVVVVLAGAVGSLAMTLHAGHKNNSVLLVVLFASWVLSPFIAFLITNVISRLWNDLKRKTLYYIMIFLPIVSLVSYSGAISPPGMKPAFIFLVAPLISWLFLGIFILIAVSQSRRETRKMNKE
jgi:phosphate/sulfate permease